MDKLKDEFDELDKLNCKFDELGKLNDESDVISKQNLIKMYHVVQELCAFSLTDHDRPDYNSAKPRHRFEYQCLGNVKMYKYAKFDQNLPYSSRVISIFTKNFRPAELIIDEASSVAGQC